MKSFREFLGENVAWRQQDGESEIVHHVTHNSFSKFLPFSHFGSHGAARAVGSDKRISNDDISMRHIAARIKLGNVAHIKDTPHHDGHSIAKLLHDAGHFSDNDMRDFNQTGLDRHEFIKKRLKQKGINTLAYKNEYEDKGSTSYMITHPSQVRVLRKTKKTYINYSRGKVT